MNELERKLTMQRRSFLGATAVFLAAPLSMFGAKRDPAYANVDLPEGGLVIVNGQPMQVGNHLIRIYTTSGKTGWAIWNESIQSFVIVSLTLNQETMSFYAEPCQFPTAIKQEN